MNREHYFCHEVIRNQTHILSADSLILKECCICNTDKKKNYYFLFDIPVLSFPFSEYEDGHGGRDMEKLFREVSPFSPPIVQPQMICMNNAVQAFAQLSYAVWS